MGASLDTGNRGVSALAASLVRNVREALPGADVFFFIGARSAQDRNLSVDGKEETIRFLNFRLSPKARPGEHLFGILAAACLWRSLPFPSVRRFLERKTPLLEKLLDADYVGDIRGGDSFSDIYGLKRFAVGVLPGAVPLILGKKYTLLPQTYGPYSSGIAKRVARIILRRAHLVLTRDREGIGVVEERLGKPAGAGGSPVFCPDVAFTMESVAPEDPRIDPPLPERKGFPIVGLNVNGLMYNGGYTRDNAFGLKFDYREFVPALVRRFLAETDAHILLVPHTLGEPGSVNNDSDACRDVLAGLGETGRGRVHLLLDEYDQYRIKGMIGRCDFFVGSRMHACIAGLSQGIPTVGVAYSRKFLGVFESVGAGALVVDARAEDLEQSLRRVVGIFRNREKCAPVVRRNVARAARRIQDVFRGWAGGDLSAVAPVEAYFAGLSEMPAYRP